MRVFRSVILDAPVKEVWAAVRAFVRFVDALPGIEMPDHGRTLDLLQPLSSLKAERDLGLRARPLEETVDETLAWFREQGYLVR